MATICKFDFFKKTAIIFIKFKIKKLFTHCCVNKKVMKPQMTEMSVGAFLFYAGFIYTGLII